MNRFRFVQNSRRGWRTAGALLLAAALAGCSAGGKEAAAPVAADASAVPSVKVESIAKHSMGDPREQVANVNASVQLDVVSLADGKVLEVLKKNGESVTEGEVLVRIDPKTAESQKEKAESALDSARQSLTKSTEDLQMSKNDLQNTIAKAETQLAELEKDYNKLRNDYDAGLVTKRQVEQAANQLDSTRRDVEATRQKLASLNSTNSLAALQSQVETSQLTLQDAEDALDNYAIEAPASGVLTDLNADIGMNMARGAKVGVVQGIDKVKIKADLTESAAKLARGKQELVFYSADNPSAKQTAKVTYLAELINTQTKMFPLELEADNANGALKPGSRVQVQLTTPEEETVTAVPTLSIVREGGDTFVYVVKGDQTEKRQVKLGRLNGAYQEVLEGVQPAEQLVVSGQHQLKDGQKVTIKPGQSQPQ